MLSRDADTSPAHANGDDLLDRNDALDRMLELAVPLAPTSMTLREASGLWLAADVVAPTGIPAFDHSAMDGFALRSSDAAAASLTNPVSMPVTQMIAAGDRPEFALPSKSVARIMTGAPLPPEADAVLEFERVEIDDSTGDVVIKIGVARGRNVRLTGEHVREGSIIARSGDILTPARTGLLASAGVESVFVRRRPRVALIVTGAEVIAPGTIREPGQVYDALTPLLDGFIRAVGGEPVVYMQAPDDAGKLRSLLGRIAYEAQPDLVITTAGISAGDRDAVRAALGQNDHVQFVRLRMKPGRPLAFGQVCGSPSAGLPGNPLAATVSFLQFIVPMIRRMAGDLIPVPRALVALATMDLPSDPESDRLLCGLLESDREGRLMVTCIDDPRRQGLHSLARANCLIIVPRGGHDISQSEYVEVILLPGADFGREL